ncbi:MAG TPA: ribosomal protein S18-alanine N-acetyltransferase [Oscillospiraceae bacterium]|nr:ribosomal protein S18-alanine N-acetyltransferase [Oscillospiraceae bacterium]
MAFRVIDADAGLLPGIERIEQECFSVPWTMAQLTGQLPDGEHLFLAAVDEAGAVAGYVGAQLAADEGYISNVAVSPAYRRLGVGGALIDALKERASARTLAFLTLEVRETNAAARALYEKHGFTVVGRRKNYYEKPREDAILMTLFLTKRGIKLEDTGI